MSYISFTKANCKNCYKCLRSCPVKAIKFKNEQAEIVEDRCIACSHCLAICPQNARKIVSDLDIVKNAIKSGKKVIASVAPSFPGYFNFEPNKIISAMKSIGFFSVEETAIGAEIVTEEYRKYISANNHSIYITTACPSIVFLVQQYYPDLTKYLLPVVSPMIAHGKLIKSIHGEDTFVVFIGPCAAKKIESKVCDSTSVIDAVITFDELKLWFNESNIDMDSLPDASVNSYTLNAGRSYPIDNGIINGLKNTANDNQLTTFSVSGTDDCMEIFSSISNGDLNNVLIEANTCKNSCVGGPTMIKSEHGYYKRLTKVKEYITSESRTDSSSFISIPSNIDFTRTIIPKPIVKNIADEEEVIKILKEMGKYSIEDELNCGVCGYNTCREKAQAIYEGMAETLMCLHFMRTKAERLSNVIFESSTNCIMLVSKQLKIIEVNPSFEKTFMVKKENIINMPVNSIMDDTDFLKVLATETNITGKKLYIPEYNAVFIENIVYLPKQGILLASMFNIMEEEKNKLELQKLKVTTLNAAQQVIEKQMRVAQEIASLLGETTAETKIVLTKLKKLVAGEDGDS